jgi:hypothetical protein
MPYRNDPQTRGSRHVPHDFGAGRSSYEEFRQDRYPSTFDDPEDYYEEYPRNRRGMNPEQRYGGQGDERPFRGSSPYSDAGNYPAGGRDRYYGDSGRTSFDSGRGYDGPYGQMGRDRYFSPYDSGMSPSSRSGSSNQSGGLGSAWEEQNQSWGSSSHRSQDQSSGQYAGRGPKGYQRNDERIREEISDRLTAHPGVDASDVEVKVENGEITLTGTVPSRHCKRAAEDIAEQCAGVKDVNNQLKVKTGSNGQDSTSSESKEERNRGSAQTSPSSSKR